jgi:hypothetical protein
MIIFESLFADQLCRFHQATPTLPDVHPILVQFSVQQYVAEES